MCVNAEPWRTYCGQPPCGQLNPLNNFTYMVLGKEAFRKAVIIFNHHKDSERTAMTCIVIMNWEKLCKLLLREEN